MIDLHTHTTASDGTTPPESIVTAATSAGIHLLSITDHDTFDGWDRARPFAEQAGLRLIPGVELSTTLDADAAALLPGFRADVHLLAYFPDGAPPERFRLWVASLLESRWERNRLLLQRLGERGLAIDEAALRSHGGPVAGRVHLARLLRELGHVTSIEDAFTQFFGEEAADYVPRRCPMLRETIRQVRDAGGIPSLAHPIRFWGGRLEAADHLCQWLAGIGLQALEVWHSEQPEDYSRWLENLAEANGLGATGGSDFHGTNKPGIALGVGRGDSPLVPARGIRWSGVDSGIERAGVDCPDGSVPAVGH